MVKKVSTWASNIKRGHPNFSITHDKNIMSTKEINLESQISEQDQKTFGGMFSVRKIVIGVTGIVFVVGGIFTYAYKDQLFGSKKDASFVALSNVAASAPTDVAASAPTNVAASAPTASFTAEDLTKKPTVALASENAASTPTSVTTEPVIKTTDQNLSSKTKTVNVPELNGGSGDGDDEGSGDDDIHAKEQELEQEQAAKEKEKLLAAQANKELAAQKKEIIEMAAEEQATKELVAQKKEIFEMAAEEQATKELAAQAVKEKADKVNESNHVSGSESGPAVQSDPNVKAPEPKVIGLYENDIKKKSFDNASVLNGHGDDDDEEEDDDDDGSGGGDNDDTASDVKLPTVSVPAPAPASDATATVPGATDVKNTAGYLSNDQTAKNSSNSQNYSAPDAQDTTTASVATDGSWFDFWSDVFLQ